LGVVGLGWVGVGGVVAVGGGCLVEGGWGLGGGSVIVECKVVVVGCVRWGFSKGLGRVIIGRVI
jgi:hypothetical protein